MKKYLDKKVLYEALQEMARVAFFASVSALVAYGLKQLSGQDQSQTVVLVGTLLLKGLDKYVHDNPAIKSNGLTDTKNFNFIK